ncbi:MAG TPA: DUF2254 family protein [Polyangiaceae bacterium]|nr:DUF2254 family protein [Polyangiaceae bacterium]
MRQGFSKSRGPFASELRVWLYPLSILLGAALAVFVLTVLLDAVHYEDPSHVLDLVLEPNPSSAQNTLSSAGEVVAAVLAIAITVVAIIVELASNRYTHRITELFVREPINFLVMGFFVLTALQGLWVNLIIDYQPGRGGFVPYISIGVAMAMLTLCLLMLLPYFAYVFEFLNPINIVGRIREKTLAAVQETAAAPGRVLAAQEEAVRGLEQLADVSLNAMEHKDKGVSMAGVDAMSSLLVDYQGLRKSLPATWFGIDGRLAHNPDFVSMAPEVLEELREQRIWLEWKILRGYQSLYNEALNKMRDINYLIAINTRLIATAAWEHDNPELLHLVIKFFNTYLRSAINAHDIRTAYNVLNQYRLLAEESLRRDPRGYRAVEIAKYFKYYGLLSFHAKQPFILETVAYDMCALTEFAFDAQSPSTGSLLRIVLQVDKEGESETQEASLRGVRKAQLKLASYFLLQGDEALAREVYQDMKDERPERLASIRDELLNVHSREFWEVSDRGFNFDYLSGERKNRLLAFFEWFGDILPPPRISIELPASKLPMPVEVGTAPSPRHAPAARG